MPDRDTDVVIVGAGAAGLAAAAALEDAGRDVAILEARERIGGRILTLHIRDLETPVELGAEFIHGTAEPVRHIATRYRLPMVDIAPHYLASSRGRLSPIKDFPLRLSRVMRRLGSHTGSEDRSFAGALRANRRHLSAADRALALQFVQGFDAADPEQISERALIEGGTPGDDVRETRIGRLLGGYGSLIDRLAEPVRSRIRLGSIVSAVRWERGRVEVECRDFAGGSGNVVSARAAIITAPIGVLTASPGSVGAIAFDPPLLSVERTLSQLAMGPVVRVALRFASPFWLERRMAERLSAPSLDQATFIMTRTRLPFAVFWTTYPVRAPLLVTWVGGPGAHDIARHPLAELERDAVRSIASLFSTTPRAIRAQLAETFYHDWVNDPFARGAYSYSRVGGYNAPRELARPIRGTIWIAGEATDSQGDIGTVHAAIASGERAARQILQRSRA
jgi:monoamine oxidase